MYLDLNIKTGGTTEEVPDWRKADWVTINNKVGDERWRRSVFSKGAEDAWTEVKTKLQELTERFIPKKKRRNTQKNRFE